MHTTHKHPLLLIHIIDVGSVGRPALVESPGRSRRRASRPSATHGSPPTPWAASCRTTPTVGDPRPNRTVAMFYWTWHVDGKASSGRRTQRDRHPPPEAINDYNHPIWNGVGPIGGHHWNEPLFGYYRGTDPWVYRKHAEMLADAGVDVVVFDSTNGSLTWKKPTTSSSRSGWPPVGRRADAADRLPVPFAPHEDPRQHHQIYDEVYRPGRFKDLWFSGKASRW